MIDDILIEASLGEVRAVMLRDGQIERLVIDRGIPHAHVGDVCLGRVHAIAAGLDAAFVDIGDARPGLLPLRDVPNTGNASDSALHPIGIGDAVIVQVVREPDTGKGTKLTAKPHLVGRALVYMPRETGLHWSKRLRPVAPAIRQSLRDAVEPLPGGWVVRTAAEQKAPEDVAGEALSLRARWEAIEAAAANTRPPAPLQCGLDPVSALIAEATTKRLGHIVVEGGRKFAALKAAFPEFADRFVAHVGMPGLLRERGIEAEIEALLDPVVRLPGGGRVTFTQAPALLAVDVDSADAKGGDPSALAVAVNRQAMVAIAERLRICDLSGHVVVDPLSMRRAAQRDNVLAALRAAVVHDRRPVEVAGYTALGKIELVRARGRLSLHQNLMVACPACHGSGLVLSAETTAIAALRAVLAEDHGQPGSHWRVAAAPAVIAVLRDGATAEVRRATERRLGRTIELVDDRGLAPDGWRIEPVNGRLAQHG